MAWGGSISQVAQNELVLSAQQRAAHERELATLIQQLESRRDNSRQDRQLDQRDSAAAEQRRQFDTSMSADSAREGRLNRQFDSSLQLQREQIGERRGERQENEAWRRKVFTMNEQDRKLRELMPYADDMAGQGMFESTEDVIKHFPSLAPAAPAIAARSKAARLALESQVNADRADADLLNEGPGRVNRLQHMITAEKDASWNPDRNHWFSKNEPDEAALGEWQNELNSINTARSAVMGDRNRMGRLVPDTSGRYSPATSLPWRTGSANTSTNAQPAAQPQAKPQGQFKPGMMVIQNGVTYRFDGQNWLPLK